MPRRDPQPQTPTHLTSLGSECGRTPTAPRFLHQHLQPHQLTQRRTLVHTLAGAPALTHSAGTGSVSSTDPGLSQLGLLASHIHKQSSHPDGRPSHLTFTYIQNPAVPAGPRQYVLLPGGPQRPLPALPPLCSALCRPLIPVFSPATCFLPAPTALITSCHVPRSLVVQSLSGPHPQDGQLTGEGLFLALPQARTSPERSATTSSEQVAHPSPSATLSTTRASWACSLPASHASRPLVTQGASQPAVPT